MTNGTAQAMRGREWAMLVTLAVLWGGAFFFYKFLDRALPPFSVVLGRIGLAAVMLNLWLLLRRDAMPRSPRLWRDFAVMSLLNNVIPFSLIAFGETRIASGLAAILNATTPLFAVLVAHAFTADEKLAPRKIAGALVGFAGVVVLIGPTVLAGLSGGDTMGELACLGAAFIYAFAGVYGRRFKGISPIKVATGQVTCGSLILLPVVVLVDRPWTLPAPGATTWLALAAFALLCTVLAYILFFRILAAAGATNVLLVTFLVPLTALLLGALALGEALHVRELVGMAVIGLGLAFIDGRLLSMIPRRRRPAGVGACRDGR